MSALLVATVGAGLYRSGDLGSSWAPDPGIPTSARLYSLWCEAGQVLAGGDSRVYRRAGGMWREIPLPPGSGEVSAVCAVGSALLAGTRSEGLCRSENGGATWERVEFPAPPESPARPAPGVAQLLPSRSVRGEVWAAVEGGGVFATSDAGRSWSSASEGIPSLDVHGLAWSLGGILVAALPTGMATWRSARWFPGVFEPGERYCRALVGRTDMPGTLYCGFGDGVPGTGGGVAVSTDGGRSWRTGPFPEDAGSTIWSLATAADPPGLVLACSIRGKVYLSLDGAEGWRLVLDTRTEARAVAWVPD